MNDCIKDNSLWIVFDKGQPLVKKSIDGQCSGLAFLSTDQVKHFLGEEPYFGQSELEGQIADPSISDLESARIRGPRIVFLGSAIPQNTLAQDVRVMIDAGINHQYPSYFAFDISGHTTPENATSLLHLVTSGDDHLEFSEPRMVAVTFSTFDASLFAQAKSMVDWNLRNRFCPACGEPNYSLWAGWKLSCTTLLPFNNRVSHKDPCPSSQGLQNYVHPRTDAVVIVAVISSDGDRILLGRSKRFPHLMYSCLAGFLEPGESPEEGVKREVMEESGVSVRDVQYHSAQPWPYPASLMLGCYAIAERESIQLMDCELEDAQFFSKAQVRKALGYTGETTMAQAEGKKVEDPSLLPHDRLAGSTFRVPPRTAIAGVLISEWALGHIFLKANL